MTTTHPHRNQYPPTHTHTHSHTHTHACTHTHTHTQSHTHIQTHTYTYTHMQTHTHTHADTQCFGNSPQWIRGQCMKSAESDCTVVSPTFWLLLLLCWCFFVCESLLTCWLTFDCVTFSAIDFTVPRVQSSWLRLCVGSVWCIFLLCPSRSRLCAEVGNRQASAQLHISATCPFRLVHSHYNVWNIVKKQLNCHSCKSAPHLPRACILHSISQCPY